MRISDWSSDVCSSDLFRGAAQAVDKAPVVCRVRNLEKSISIHGIDDILAHAAGAVPLAGHQITDRPGFFRGHAFERVQGRELLQQVVTSSLRERWSPKV